MKKFIGIVLIFISISAFAQNPILDDGALSFNSNSTNTYYFQYNGFVTPGLYPMGWGINCIDLDPTTPELDWKFDGPGFKIEAIWYSTFLMFQVDQVGLPGTISKFKMEYLVTDIFGNESNIADLRFKIYWPDTNQ